MRDGRRAARRTSAAAAAACLVLSVALPALAQDGEGAPPPAIWRGAASSVVAQLEVDRDALLPIPGVLRFAALAGESAFETDRQTARASLFFPGEGLIQGPNLACGTFGSAFPPEFQPVLDACLSYDYPLTVRADASAPDRSTQGRLQLGTPSDAVSGLALGANAHAAPDGARTHAALEDLRVLGLPGIDIIPLLPIQDLQLDPSVVVIGSATSRTDQRIVDGSLVVEASSSLSDVRLVGGLVRIGGLRSISRITDDADGTRTADADLEVSGVTVAGLPAQITADGLVLGNPSDLLGPIQRQLQAALRPLLDALGVRITLLETEETTDDGTGQAVASAAGVLVEVSLNVDGLPSVPGPLGDIDLNGTYVGSVQLGYSGASGAASMFDPDAVSVDTGDPGGGLVVDGGGGFTPGGSLPDLGSTPPPPSGEAAPTRGPVRAGALTDPFDGRLELLYAAFAFAVLALCLTPRLAVPARLPGPRP